MLRRIATAVVHQLACPYGLAVVTAFLVFEGVGVFRGTADTARSLLTTNPFYPFQVVVGFATGYLVGRLSEWSFARWTWVFPVSVLLIVLVFAPVPAGLSRSEYFFGWSGLPKRGMVPWQLAGTMPVYLSGAYSLAAWKGMRDRSKQSMAKPVIRWRVIANFIFRGGLLIVLAPYVIYMAATKAIPWVVAIIVVPAYAALSYGAFRTFWPYLFRKPEATSPGKSGEKHD